MAEFMAVAEEEENAPRKKGPFKDVLAEMRHLSQNQRDKELVKRFRFHEDGIHFLCELLSEKLTAKYGNRGNPVPIPLQIMMALQYLGGNSFELHIGKSYGVSQATVSQCINRVFEAIADKSGQFVHLPKGQDLARIKTSFYNYCGLPHIMGAIDCTHIRIQCPTSADEQSYINRKGFYSINMQAIVNNECKFINVDITWPGATHDCFVLRQSAIWDFFENGNGGNSILLGDKGYPLKSWLIIPYRNPNTAAENRFNYALTRGRSTVERAFGILKKRFYANHNGYRLPLANVANAILASVVLHNFALDMKLPLIEDDQFNDEQPPEEDFEEFQDRPQWRSERQQKLAAIAKRQELTARFQQ